LIAGVPCFDGCGLVLWSILLDGTSPWELEIFGFENSRLAFKRPKGMANVGIVDTALATFLDSPSVLEGRRDWQPSAAAPLTLLTKDLWSLS